MIKKITGHSAEAKARLTEQFRGKPKMDAVVAALVAPVQRAEDTAWQLLTERGVDTAIGAQLDAIGKVVGEKRAGKDDASFRRYIRAAIRMHRSNGTTEDILAVARLILDLPDAYLHIFPGYPLGITLVVEDAVVDEALATTLISFLKRTVSATVKIVSVTWPSASELMLTCPIFASTTTALVAGGAGTSIIEVDSIVGFPDEPGTLLLDAGLATQETVTYGGTTVVGSTKFFAGVSDWVYDHPIGTSVALVDDVGLGLGDSTNAATGGALASAKGN